MLAFNWSGFKADGMTEVAQVSEKRPSAEG
jgi:hypothetical protein